MRSIFTAVFFILLVSSVSSGQIVHKSAVDALTYGTGTITSTDTWAAFLVGDVPPGREEYGNSNGLYYYDDNFTIEMYGNSVVVSDPVSTQALVKYLDEGEEIGSGSVWHNNTGWDKLPIVTGPTHTEWNGETGYAGIVVYTVGGDCYGWLKFDVAADGSSITLVDMAYNSTPGESILAGQTEISTDIEIVNELPNSFELSQNYPNPFNPSTVINFSLPEASNVKLTIFNSLGEMVSTLVDKRLEVGSYSYQFEANNLPTGIYIYRLSSASFISSKKMLLIK